MSGVFSWYVLAVFSAVQESNTIRRVRDFIPKKGSLHSDCFAPGFSPNRENIIFPLPSTNYFGGSFVDSPFIDGKGQMQIFLFSTEKFVFSLILVVHKMAARI